MLNLVALYCWSVLAGNFKGKFDGLHVTVNSLADQGGVDAWKMIAKELVGDVLPSLFEVCIFPQPFVDGDAGNPRFNGYSTNRPLKADFPSGIKHQELLVGRGPFRIVLCPHTPIMIHASGNVKPRIRFPASDGPSGYPTTYSA